MAVAYPQRPSASLRSSATGRPPSSTPPAQPAMPCRAKDGSPTGSRRAAARCEARQPDPAQRGRAQRSTQRRRHDHDPQHQRMCANHHPVIARDRLLRCTLHWQTNALQGHAANENSTVAARLRNSGLKTDAGRDGARSGNSAMCALLEQPASSSASVRGEQSAQRLRPSAQQPTTGHHNLQPRPGSANALLAMPTFLFSLPTTWRR